MAHNKTVPSDSSIDAFLASVSIKRRQESLQLIAIMSKISGDIPALWGTSIIGFGSQHYTYDTGREGDMPRLGFSPRKAAITIYFTEGFDRYVDQMSCLGTFTSSVSCLYIKKLTDINMSVLERMLRVSYTFAADPLPKPTTAEEYVIRVPATARKKFDELRHMIQEELPQAKEVLSYGVLGYKIDDKRARVFIAGWKDHVSMYPIPKDVGLVKELKPYAKGKGTLWFMLHDELPHELLRRTVRALLD